MKALNVVLQLIILLATQLFPRTCQPRAAAPRSRLARIKRAAWVRVSGSCGGTDKFTVLKCVPNQHCIEWTGLSSFRWSLLLLLCWSSLGWVCKVVATHTGAKTAQHSAKTKRLSMWFDPFLVVHKKKTTISNIDLGCFFWQLWNPSNTSWAISMPFWYQFTPH